MTTGGAGGAADGGPPLAGPLAGAAKDLEFKKKSYLFNFIFV